MKRFIITAWLALGFGSGAWAVLPEVIVNYGKVTNAPLVDATALINYGTITFNTVTVNSNFVYPVGDSAGFNSIPFSTRDTLYYTNATSGTIAGTNGVVFETITSSAIRSAASFVNHGTVTGFDFPAIADTYSTTAGTTAIPAGSVPVASDIEVLATNIFNDGTISVGNYGLLHMAGKTVSTLNGALVAGALNTGGGNGLEYDPLDTTGGGDTVEAFYDFGGNGYYVNPPGVYDLYWGVTPVKTTLALDQFNPPFTTGVFSGTRQSEGGTIGFELPLTANPIWSTNVYSYVIDESNTFFNIVFVNTNFFDVNGQPNPNITATVGFTDEFFSLNNGEFDTEPMVQFALTVPDVVTGQVVTNAVYLVDIGGVLNVSPFTENNNAGSADDFNRPQAFALTTTTPLLWPYALPANFPYDPGLIYEPGTYTSKDVAYQVAAYGAQIGRNPAQLDGSFSFNTLLTDISGGSFNGVYGDLGEDLVILPDPTNEGARIELTANQLDLSNSRLRAEGMVIINASNLVGQTIGSDWGQINSQIGATNGSLVISNFYPTNFQRLRGDIYAYTANWVNVFTNGLTNTFHYNLLVVDQNLGGNFRSVIRDLNLTGTKSVNVQDSLYVINQFYFNTSNLTFNSDVVFTQNAGNLTPANMPGVKNFLNNSNASLAVDSVLDIGYDVTKLPTPPAKRKYTVTSITNLGTMTATAPLFQSEIFENDGAIMAGTNGSMIIEASSLGLGLALTNATNYLVAGDNITLSADSIQITNSQIIAGGTNNLGTGLLLLQTTSTGQITDFVPGRRALMPTLPTSGR